ncbi:MAG: protein-(glutamine-N5) methyltransferase, release factor-specific [Epulopiscium sp. Nuni2H_MBin003]|nr:MAG: protein-(glutamine-N5) methyltransferase, release factor-specific [Epulopiscium sp. Nuni2H_MBin003]
MTISKTINIGIKILQEANVLDAIIDARLLLMHKLNCDRNYIILNGEKDIDEQIYLDYLSLINRRKCHEPLQYITNSQEFMGLEFFVDNRVLIPRQDTEILVENIIEFSKQHTLRTGIEIGVGSGCISISLVRFIKGLAMTSCDISSDAIAVAKFNATKHNCEINFIKSDILRNMPHIAVDFIVSNPPYIPKDEYNTLELEVYREPHIALSDNADGLSFYRNIATTGYDFLKKGGFIALEIGYNQGQDVIDILKSAGYLEIRLILDYNKKDRVVFARKGE